MAGAQKGGQLLAWGHIDSQSDGAWLVGEAGKVLDPAGVDERLRDKLWIGRPGGRYDATEGGYVRKITERVGWHECVRVMKGVLGWWPGEAPHPRYYSILQGSCNLDEQDEGRWILPPDCTEPAMGSTLLTPRSVPYPQDGYSAICEQHVAAARLTLNKDAVLKRLSWPDHPGAFRWKKTLIKVFGGKLEILGEITRTKECDVQAADVLEAGGYAFFEAFDPGFTDRHTLLPLRFSPLGDFRASVLFF